MSEENIQFDQTSQTSQTSQTQPPPQMPPVQRTIIRTRSGGRVMPFLGGVLTGCCMVFLLALLSFVLCCVGIYKLCSDASGSIAKKGDSNFGEKIIEDGTDEEGRSIQVINVHGVITSASSGIFDDEEAAATSSRICRLIKEARENDSTVAVILDMDTPGGEVVASDEIRQEVDKCRAQGLPVVTCIRTVGASGGYYIASGSDWIIASPISLTGSVGVIMSGMEFSALLEKIGVSPMVYRSGSFKDIGSSMRKPTPAEQAYMQGLIDETFGKFCEVVASGRPANFADASAVRRAPFGDGRPVSGKAALAYGMIDELGGMEAAIAKARELSEVPEAKVVRRSNFTNDFLESLFSARAGQGTIRIEGLPVRSTVLKPGTMYYIMPEAI